MQSVTQLWFIWKSLIKAKSFNTKQFQQDYLPESYAWYIPFYQKCQKIVARTRCGLPPSPESLWETLGMDEILPKRKTFTNFPHQKNSL